MITVRDLAVRIDGRPLLEGISFEVAPRESLGIVGPNGSGKSTLLRCLLGLVPFTGRAAVCGFDVAARSREAKALMGYLPQRPAFGDARAGEYLRFVARLRGLPAVRADDALAEVGLSDHAGARARTFSGGMQQRLSLAAALMIDAPVLLLDEPTASLDFEGQQAFLEIAALLRERGRTLLIASHRPEELARLTDRILHLDRGRASLDAPSAAGPSNVVKLPRLVG